MTSARRNCRRKLQRLVTYLIESNTFSSNRFGNDAIFVVPVLFGDLDHDSISLPYSFHLTLLFYYHLIPSNHGQCIVECLLHHFLRHVTEFAGTLARVVFLILPDRHLVAVKFLALCPNNIRRQYSESGGVTLLEIIVFSMPVLEIS